MVQINYEWLPKSVKIDDCEHYLQVTYQLQEAYGTGINEEQLKQQITKKLGKLEKILKTK
jgi:hypothetical protein